MILGAKLNMKRNEMRGLGFEPTTSQIVKEKNEKENKWESGIRTHNLSGIKVYRIIKRKEMWGEGFEATTS